MLNDLLNFFSKGDHFVGLIFLLWIIFEGIAKCIRASKQKEIK